MIDLLREVQRGSLASPSPIRAPPQPFDATPWINPDNLNPSSSPPIRAHGLIAPQNLGRRFLPERRPTLPFPAPDLGPVCAAPVSAPAPFRPKARPDPPRSRVLHRPPGAFLVPGPSWVLAPYPERRFPPKRWADPTPDPPTHRILKIRDLPSRQRYRFARHPLAHSPHGPSNRRPDRAPARARLFSRYRSGIPPEPAPDH